MNYLPKIFNLTCTFHNFLGKYQSQFGAGSQYAYYHDEDESTFHLVDTARVQKPPYQRGRFLRNQRNMRGRGGGRGAQNQFQMLGKGLKSRERLALHVMCFFFLNGI